MTTKTQKNTKNGKPSEPIQKNENKATETAKKADQFGHTHSVSHFTPKAKLETAEPATEAPAAKPRKKK